MGKKAERREQRVAAAKAREEAQAQARRAEQQRLDREHPPRPSRSPASLRRMITLLALSGLR